MPTDERLAKLVGTILYTTNSGNVRLADAHLVAVCDRSERAIVITGDSADIHALAIAVPGTRIVARSPAAIAG